MRRGRRQGTDRDRKAHAAGAGRPGVTRRDMLTASAAVVATAPLLAATVEAAVQSRTTFFTAAELALVDELTEIVVPADDHSPGARAAGVAAYLDRRLAEAPDAAGRDRWRSGLQAVDALSNDMHRRPFMQASASERLAVVTRMAKNEGAPKTAAEQFFGLLKAATITAYYTSKIGIHQEMEYKGNTLLTEFVGE